MYQWIIYSITTGALGTHEQTQSPMVDVNGTMEFDANLIPSGFAVLGPYDASNPMDSAAQAAYDNPQEYLYQNGAFVSNPNYTQIQFNQALSAKNAWLTLTFEEKIISGFPSSADDTQRTYAIDPTSMGKWTGILANINAGNVTGNTLVKDIKGTKVTLTPTQFKQFALDGFNYFNNVEQTMWTKEPQIEACTTQTELDTIGWPNPNPPSIPSGLSGTAGTQEVALSWTANTDVTMIGGSYNVYVNGAKNNTSLVTGTTYTVTGLTTGTAYDFSITAVDTDGNESVQCTAISVTPN